MIILAGTQGAGKTVKVLQYAASNGLTIVCASLDHVRLLQIGAIELGLLIKDPITISQYLSNPRGHTRDRNARYILDDLEAILQVILNNNVVAASVDTTAFAFCTHLHNEANGLSVEAHVTNEDELQQIEALAQLRYTRGA